MLLHFSDKKQKAKIKIRFICQFTGIFFAKTIRRIGNCHLNKRCFDAIKFKIRKAPGSDFL